MFAMCRRTALQPAYYSFDQPATENLEAQPAEDKYRSLSRRSEANREQLTEPEQTKKMEYLYKEMLIPFTKVLFRKGFSASNY
jgi:hypothetical protein